MAFSKEVAAHLFKAEHFPNLEFRAGDNSGLLEWVEWEVSKVTRAMNALSYLVH